MRNSIGIKIICVMFLIIIAFLLCSCNKEVQDQELGDFELEEQDWELAVSENTIEGYNRYLEKWADSKNEGYMGSYKGYSKIAEDEIAWLEAHMTKTEEGFREYSANHNKYKEEVGGFIKDCSYWESKLDIWNNRFSAILDGLYGYLNEHPDGLFVEEARDMIAYHENWIDIINTLQPVSSGNGIIGAGDYDPDLPDEDNKIVILDNSGLLVEFENLNLPEELIPSSLEEVTLVIVIIDTKFIIIETAEYTADGFTYKTYERKQQKMSLELREAKTGDLVKSGTIVSAEPEEFPYYINDSDSSSLSTRIGGNRIIEWFYTAIN